MKRICDMMPTLYEGTMPDGSPWVFRARRGEWALHVHEGACFASGQDPTHGDMPAHVAEPLIRALMEVYACTTC